MASVSPNSLTGLRALLFTRQESSPGPRIARAIGVKYITFWSWINRRGVPADRVETIANALTALSAEYLEAATELRRAARTNEQVAA